MGLLDGESMGVNPGWFTFADNDGEGGAFVWSEF